VNWLFNPLGISFRDSYIYICIYIYSYLYIYTSCWKDARVVTNCRLERLKLTEYADTINLSNIILVALFFIPPRRFKCKGTYTYTYIYLRSWTYPHYRIRNTERTLSKSRKKYLHDFEGVHYFIFCILYCGQVTKDISVFQQER
jgi:hypothetical protein